MNLKANQFLKFLPILFLLFTTQISVAQTKKDTTKSINSNLNSYPIGTIESRELFKRKGNAFVYWGYNRAEYSNSDIRFHGDGYDFSVTNISAIDQPCTDFMTYIRPSTVSVPQFNFRMGYFINDKTFICIGWDHMKYGIIKQATHLTGTITKDNKGNANVGTYNHTEVLVGEEDEAAKIGPSIIDSLKSGFVSNFEHCDGLNDVAIELGRMEQLWISKNRLDALAVVGSVGIGGVVPDTDADILGYAPKHDMSTGKKAFHLAGYSFSASIGLQFDFFKHFFLQGRLKAGYVNLPDINTTIVGGKASQHFTLLEPMMVFGYTFSLYKK